MCKKTIILVAVCDVKGSTNVPMAQAFQKFGYKVIPVNYRSIIKKYGMQFFETLLIKTSIYYKPELILYSKTNIINPNLIIECNKYSKSFYWFMDPVETAKRIKYITDYAKNATYSSCTSVDMTNWFKELGVSPCYHILEGFDYDVLKPTEVFEEYKADISFIGTRTPERDMYKKRLEAAEYKVKFYGPDYSGSFVTGKEFAKICSSSKFMLSLNTYNNIPNYFSDRLILFTGCGACTFHLDSTRTLNNYYQDGKEIMYFSDIDELIIKLKNIDDNKACEVAFKGRERTLRDYTWDVAIQKIINVISYK